MLKIQYSYFEYKIVLFDLSHILATFQHYINKIIAEKFDIIVIIYLNHILIYSNKMNYIDLFW